jgi:SAM-dependent methyltransferase
MSNAFNMISLGTFAVVASMVYQGRTRRKTRQTSPVGAEQARQLLARAAPLLRLPTSPASMPTVLADGSGLHCPSTGRVYPYRNGILDLLEHEPTLTETQQLLNTPFTAWAYDRGRDALLRLCGGPSFAREVAMTQASLQIQPGDTVLDLACGQGNFTVEWAKRTGPDGLIIGLDISDAMLRRAASRVTRAHLNNVLLIRGDALRLPFADESFSKTNCSGGFHQLPDLPRALHEVSRVSTPNAVLTASTFAEGPDDRWAGLKRWLKQRFQLHFVPLDQLERQLAAVGFQNYIATLPGGWFGYTSTRKNAA